MLDHILDRENPAIENSLSKTFMANVFAYMGVGVGITAVLSWAFAYFTALANSMYVFEDGHIGYTTLGMVIAFSPLAFLLVFMFGLNKLSTPATAILFAAYAAVIGISMSSIFFLYDLGTIYVALGSTAGMFGFMAIMGYTTKQDLTKMGSLLSMAVIGLIIAMVINMFVGSESFSYLISAGAVIIFVGLTAYKVQELKRIGAGVQFGSASSQKLALFGAFSLYLYFIIIFQHLLHLLGRND